MDRRKARAMKVEGELKKKVFECMNKLNERTAQHAQHWIQSLMAEAEKLDKEYGERVTGAALGEAMQGQMAAIMQMSAEDNALDVAVQLAFKISNSNLHENLEDLGGGA